MGMPAGCDKTAKTQKRVGANAFQRMFIKFELAEQRLLAGLLIIFRMFKEKASHDNDDDNDKDHDNDNATPHATQHGT